VGPRVPQARRLSDLAAELAALVVLLAPALAWAQPGVFVSLNPGLPRPPQSRAQLGLFAGSGSGATLAAMIALFLMGCGQAPDGGRLALVAALAWLVGVSMGIGWRRLRSFWQLLREESHTDRAAAWMARPAPRLCGAEIGLSCDCQQKRPVVCGEPAACVGEHGGGDWVYLCAQHCSHRQYDSRCFPVDRVRRRGVWRVLADAWWGLPLMLMVAATMGAARADSPPPAVVRATSRLPVPGALRSCPDFSPPPEACAELVAEALSPATEPRENTELVRPAPVPESPPAPQKRWVPADPVPCVGDYWRLAYEGCQFVHRDSHTWPLLLGALWLGWILGRRSEAREAQRRLAAGKEVR